jgi:secondary thiamine-phosphate synthase enzyme
LVKERESYYTHTLEGDDDMPAHAKCSLVGASLTIPITGGRLNLGIWQGIYSASSGNMVAHAQWWRPYWVNENDYVALF